MKTKRKDSNLLYLKLRNIIYERVFCGDYRNGELIPTERELAQKYRMSRITVRSTLEMLEKEGFVTRVQGRGTAIDLKLKSTKTDMGIIGVVAPNRIPFFSQFIELFNEKAEANDSLVLLKTQTQNKDQNIEKYLFKLFVKNIRNVVIWSYGSNLDPELIYRLRGMGMNFVFFDIVDDIRYGDGVCLDNKDGLETLYSHALSEIRNNRKIAYIGWDNLAISSVNERETTFRKASKGESPVFHVRWANRWQYRSDLVEILKGLKKNMPDCLICVNSEIGIETKKILNEMGFSRVLVCCIDDDAEAKDLGVITYDQPMEQMASKVYDCLQNQNQKTSDWRPKAFRLKGKISKN